MMTVIRVHELAKKMGVESKDLILVLEKMGIKGKTPSSGLDDKETKSLIEKLKAIRKEKEKDKVKKEPGDAIASKEERLKKAAALIGKFSSTLEKPGTKPKPAPVQPLPKPVIPAPPVIPPASQVKPVVPAPAQTEEPKTAPALPQPGQPQTPPPPQSQNQQARTVRPVPTSPGNRPAQGFPRPAMTGQRPQQGRTFSGRPSFGSPVLEPSQVPPSLIPTPAPGKASKKKWQKKTEFEQKQEREFREKPTFKKLPDLKTLPTGKKPHKKDDHHAQQTDVADITKPRKKVVKIQEGCTIKEFAEVMGQKVGDVMKKRKRRDFNSRKREQTSGCTACEWNFLCHFGCQHYRSFAGENCLCGAYREFFRYTGQRFQVLASGIRTDYSRGVRI